MKALGAEAEGVGLMFFTVGVAWIHMGVSFKFLNYRSVSSDATQPHVYDVERPGDELLDLVSMCVEDAKVEQEIDLIREMYTEKILDATGYMQAYAQAENRMKVTMDSAVKQAIFESKSKVLLELP